MGEPFCEPVPIASPATSEVGVGTAPVVRSERCLSRWLRSKSRHLGQPGTPETLRGHLVELPAADVIQVATKIMNVLEDRTGPSFLLRQFKFLEALSHSPRQRGSTNS